MTKMEVTNKKIVKNTSYDGSALILTVVLTTLLATVGVLFLLLSRIDKMAASAASQNRELNHAVDTVVAKISQQLVLDVPGVVAGREYYDYPGAEDRWLANLEPCQVAAGDYRWPQISDVYNKLVSNLQLQAVIVPDYQDANKIMGEGQIADADGDGVADSCWVVIPDVNSSKGRPIYAAVRIIDNGGMINLNTAYKFDSASDGNQLTDIDLRYITKEGSSPPTQAERDTAVALLHDIRCGGDGTGSAALSEDDYNRRVAMRILNPNQTLPVKVTPFDIGEELELRNRGFIDSPALTRLEAYWKQTFLPGYPNQLRTPYDNSSDLPIWFTKASDGISGYYTRRHICTTYNFDRVIRPWVDPLVPSGMPNELRTAWQSWVSGAGRNYAQVCIADILNRSQSIELLAAAIWLGLPATTPAPGFGLTPNGYSWTTLIRTDLACQLAVNLVDYIDSDPTSSKISITTATDTKTYYGYEQGNVYISEIAVAKYNDGTNPVVTYYALELYNPHPANPVDLANWKLVIRGVPLNIGAGFIVPAAGTLIIVNNAAAAGPTGFNVSASVLAGLIFTDDDHITLLDSSGRPVDGILTGTVSSIPVPPPGIAAYNITRGNWFLYNRVPVWDTTKKTWTPGHSLGNFIPDNGAFPQIRARIQVSSRNDNLLPCVGEIFSALGIGASSRTDRTGTTYQSLPEWFNAYRSSTDLTEITAGRMDATRRDFASLLCFLTVFHPFSDGVDNNGDGVIDEPGELSVAGRININTAPWYIIAQLPWIQYGDITPFKRVQAIRDYRDKLGIYAGRLGGPGFVSTLELMQVVEMQSLASDGSDNLHEDDPNGPDFTYDTARDDLEERDLIFSRISNLVTVRSDVFTAYILIRIGPNGPQRRVIAILDRSQVTTPADKVKIIALQPVPDPR